MKHGFAKSAVAGVALAGLLGGCATSVDWGTPLGHYGYRYDSRPIVYESAPPAAYDEHGVTYVAPVRVDTYEAPARVAPPPVTVYHDDDDD